MYLHVSDSITDATSNERQDTNFQRPRAKKEMLSEIFSSSLITEYCKYDEINQDDNYA